MSLFPSSPGLGKALRGWRFWSLREQEIVLGTYGCHEVSGYSNFLCACVYLFLCVPVEVNKTSLEVLEK